MGRELKRVPLNFNWKLKKVWIGYMNPYPYGRECQDCHGSGYSKQAAQFQKEWYGYTAFDPSSTGSKPYSPSDPYIQSIIKAKMDRSRGSWGNISVQQEAERMCGFWNKQWEYHLSQEDVNALIAKGRLWDFTRDNTSYIPTADEVNRWSLQGFGHDSLNSGICIKARCHREGVDMYCPRCNGHGIIWETEYHQWLHEQWKRIEPPTGDGYQVWETVSEGSPISPVFKTENELINWLIDEGYSEGAAEQFAKHGHAFSMMIGNGRVYKDIEGLNAAHDD